ncbi:hypothetical protein FB451DRAFT_594556 [Mycena latifolia]|nr:hypothetical protein FB451DRAFT_594556 [Mycena latifolia]
MPRTYAHTINTDQAAFLGFALEAIFYGIYLILFTISIVVLLQRKPGKNASKVPMFVVTCFMFSLCTTHFGLNFNNVYDGLLVHPRPHISEETHLLAGADMLFSVTDWFSQLILIYRCYLVWGKSIWVVIFPLLMSFATVACGLALIGLVLQINPNAPQAPAALVPVGTAGFALSLCLNFIVSALIVSRIYYIARQNRIHGVSPHTTHSGAHDTTFQRAIGIIVEAGGLFLAAQFVFVVLFAIAHPAQAVVEPVATQIYGISPTLIIVRVGMGASYDTNTAPGSTLRFVGPFGGGARKSQRSTFDTRGTFSTGETRTHGHEHNETDVEMSRTHRESSSTSLPKMGPQDRLGQDEEEEV